MTEQRCVHELLPGHCTECAPVPQGLTAHVYTTAGGQVFHRTPSCAGLLDGQRQAARRGDEIHDPESKALSQVLHSKAACLVCFPGYRPGRPRP
ncbi:hypothetical protein AB0C93_20975 [Streptomyces sp. NPDC048518]|uniref:hypothetical protein n=1 Tax=Streptomyces sp. NPDC048518 TaxID=3155029 RepID=UPI0033F26520